MIPRLSIVVPYLRDEAAFETTLVSVLENRPEASEVLVPHDGSYADPFDLSDEVRFVIGGGGASLVELVAAAADAAQAMTVHVLAAGVRATEGWTEGALGQFEVESVGAVAPVLHRLGRPNRIIAAGWTTDRGRVQRPLAAGRAQTTRHDARRVFGPYLAASFWRTRALRAGLSATVGLGTDAAETVLAYGLARCGLQCRIATESTVTGTELAVGRPSAAAGHRLHVARCGCTGRPAVGALADAAWGLLQQPHRPQAWSFAAGRLSALLTGGSGIARLARRVEDILEQYEAAGRESPAVLRLPEPCQAYRRAA